MKCLVCGYPFTEEHHVYFGSGNREISEKHGFKVRLCVRHHRGSREGVHFNRELDLKIKRYCQRKFEKTHTRAEFMKLIGRNYLD